MFGWPASAAPFRTTGKRLGNGTDYFSRTNWLPVDGGDMTFVASLKFENIAPGNSFYLGGNVGGNRMAMEVGPFDATNHYMRWNRLLDTAGVTLLSGTANKTILDTLLHSWFSYVKTFRSATGAWEIWINGVKASGTGTAGVADWTGATRFGSWYDGDSPGLWMNAAHVWIAQEYVDMTAKYSDFFDGVNKPIGLGADGSLPTGRQPEHFAPAGNLEVNLGSESNWTKNGAIADSADSPTD